MKTTPEDSSNELEHLRAQLRVQQRTLDAMHERLKAQEEQANDAWELLAVLWRQRGSAANSKGKRSHDEIVSTEENEMFFIGLRVLLGKHEDRVGEALTRLRSLSKSRNN